MSSGLPVLTTAEGGMPEMVMDNRTGWIAANASVDELIKALWRALDTPPVKIAEMGRCASSDIKRICDNRKIVESHLEFRSQIVNKGAKHSVHFPLNLPWNRRSLSNSLTRHTSQSKGKTGIAFVVTCYNTGQFLEACLRSIEQQTKQPAIVIIVDDKSTEGQTIKVLRKVQQDGWQVIHKKMETSYPLRIQE